MIEAKMNSIRFGFFENFDGDNTLLFFGGGQSLVVLQEIFSSLDDGNPVSLEGDSRFLALAGAKVELLMTEEPQSGMRYIEAGKPAFRWTISRKDLPDMVAKLASVIASATRCHNYLDGDLDDVQVMVSKDEYPDTLVP